VIEPRTLSDPCPPCDGTGVRIRINPSWLRYRRKGAGITLKAMGIMLGMSKSYLSAIECGRRTCPANVAAAYDELVQQSRT